MVEARAEDGRLWQEAKHLKEIKNADWKRYSTQFWVPDIIYKAFSIQGVVTKLFQMKRYPELSAELSQLNEKLRYCDDYCFRII